MPDTDGVGGGRWSRGGRRWPAAIVALAVCASLALTSFLFVRDRQNAAAATGARSNAGKDAMALASANALVKAFGIDAALRRDGVVGLRAIVITDFETFVVAPLGGTIENGPHQWTVVLDGGFACLTWQRSPNEGVVTARRGVCTDNIPLIASPPVAAATFERAEGAVIARERAVVDASLVAGAMASSSAGYNPRFSLPVLAARFARLVDVPFRSWSTLEGLSVATTHSSACLHPSASDAQVRVTLGACR
jgi:hypothetical protein